MLKRLLSFACVMLTFAFAIPVAAQTYCVDAKDEVSVAADQLDGQVLVLTDAEGLNIFRNVNQDLKQQLISGIEDLASLYPYVRFAKVTDATDAEGTVLTGNLYTLQIVNTEGAPFEIYGGNGCINFQPAGQGIIFAIGSRTPAYGQDGKNLGLWNVSYEEGKGYVCENVGRPNEYLTPASESPVAEKAYVRLFSDFSVAEPQPVLTVDAVAMADPEEGAEVAYFYAFQGEKMQVKMFDNNTAVVYGWSGVEGYDLKLELAAMSPVGPDDGLLEDGTEVDGPSITSNSYYVTKVTPLFNGEPVGETVSMYDMDWIKTATGLGANPHAYFISANPAMWQFAGQLIITGENSGYVLLDIALDDVDGNVQDDPRRFYVAWPVPAEPAELTINGSYNDDNSSWTGFVNPITEGNSLMYTLEYGEEEAEYMGVEGAIQLAWTPGKADEFGVCKYELLVIECDAEGKIVAQGFEEVSLVKPTPKVDIVVNYNEDNSQARIFAYPTEEGNQVLYGYSEDPTAGVEGEVPATGLNMAFTPGMADPTGVCKYELYFFEVTAQMDIVATAMAEVSLVAPREPQAGESDEDPIELANGWAEEVEAAEVGADEAGYTHFKYVAQEDGKFVFSCGYEIKAFAEGCGMEPVESAAGVRYPYGKAVKAGDVVTFSAYLPQSYEGVEDEELYPVESYVFFAGVEKAPIPENFFAATPLSEIGEEGAYFFNVEAQAFLTKGNDWGTRASITIDDAGLLAKFVPVEGAETFIFQNYSNVWHQFDCQGTDQIWIDGDGRTGYDKWTYTENEDNSFTISNTNVAGYLSVVPSKEDTRVYMSEAAEAQSVWIAVTPEAFEAGKAAWAEWVAVEKVRLAKEAALAHVMEIKNFLDKTNVYTKEAYDKFNEKFPVNEWLAAVEADELDYEAVNAAYATFCPTGWHSSNDVDDLLLSAWTVGGEQCKDYDKALYINTWSTEGNNDGSEFRVPFFEYWTGDGNSLSANVLQATVTDLKPEATYEVSAWVRTRIKNGATAPVYGITYQVGDGEAVDACVGEQVGTSQMYLTTITATGKADADGKLTITFNVAADNNISWLSYKDVKYSIVLPEIALSTQYSEDYSRCKVTIEDTPAEGNMHVWALNGEIMGMVEGAFDVAPTPSQYDESGVAHLVVTVYEIPETSGSLDDAVAAGTVELDLVKPYEPIDGDSDENPIVLATGWSDVTPAEAIGVDEAGYTHFSYTAAETGTFVFSCGYEIKAWGESALEPVESTAGVRFAYGKAVKAGDVVAFSAYLPQSYEGVEDEELYPIEEYAFYANVEAGVISNLLVNGDFKDGKTGWEFTTTGDGWSDVLCDEPKVVEAYAGWGDLLMSDFAMSQKVSLAAGVYKLSAYAFYRYGVSYDVDPAKSCAQLFAGENAIDVATLGSIVKDAYPNDVNAASAAFAAGEYLNEIEFTVEQDAEIEVGIKGVHELKQSWFIAGPMTLVFVKPLETKAGDSAENPIVLATGWSEETAPAAVGKDASAFTHFSYTAENDGVFVFSCGYEISTFSEGCGMEPVEATAGVRYPYGKAVKAGDVVEFAAILPVEYPGVEDEQLYPVENYVFYANVEAETPIEKVDLTLDMYYEWDNYTADANVVGPGMGEYHIGESSGLPYGNGSVLGNMYANLSDCIALELTVTEGTPRILLNRPSMGDSGAADYIEIKSEDSPYVASVVDGVWTIDIAKIVAEFGFAHLNCIKGANWANTTITSAKLVRIYDPTAIKSVETAVKAAGIYSVSGAKLNTLQKGLNIVVDENGNAKKIMVK